MLDVSVRVQVLGLILLLLTPDDDMGISHMKLNEHLKFQAAGKLLRSAR